MKREIPLNYIAHLFATIGKIYNGYELHGVERIPKSGPALLVFYHGLIPLDCWYGGLQIYLETGRLGRALTDNWVMDTPGLNWVVETIGGVRANYDHGKKLLKQGHLVGVSPGGVREAISGQKNDYQLVWKDRKGFAKLAIETKVDIIPIFSENVEELYKAPFADKPIFQKIYEKTRLPLVPILGIGPFPFPVKLKTWIGPPIKFQEERSVDELVQLTKERIQDLIDQHQDKETNVISAMKQRFF